jgi:hypothetical protein
MLLELLVILFAIACGAGAAAFGAPSAASIAVGALAGFFVLVFILSSKQA